MDDYLSLLDPIVLKNNALFTYVSLSLDTRPNMYVNSIDSVSCLVIILHLSMSSSVACYVVPSEFVRVCVCRRMG